ncbi:hypothetical protein D3C85_1620040 [compost metagenome]
MTDSEVVGVIDFQLLTVAVKCQHVMAGVMLDQAFTRTAAAIFQLFSNFQDPVTRLFFDV